MNEILVRPSWSDQAIDILKTEWRAGTNATEIAQMISRSTGIYFGKDAIVGKANRMKLGQHMNSVRARRMRGEVGHLNRAKSGKSQHAVTDRSKSGTFGTARAEEPKFAKDQSLLDRPIWAVDSAGFSLVELTETMCRWPRGNSHPFNFCGAPVYVVGDKKYPYCEFHHSRAHTRPVVE